MSKVLAIVQCRSGSQRFPRKAFADLGGRPLIAHVIDRVRQVRGFDDVVLAVPAADVAEFKELALCWHTYGPDVPEQDVLSRFAAVAAMFPTHDTIVRITGDCPLWSPIEAELVLDLYRKTPDCQYAWNVADGYVDGEDVEVFSRAALLDAHWHAGAIEGDREHVTQWIRAHYAVTTLQPQPDRVVRKTSIDTISDLERVRLMLECVQ